jgi:kynurenine formamidase
LGLLASCTAPRPPEEKARFTPSEVIDLGALVTKDLPEQLWGKAFLDQMGFDRPNSFDVIEWTFPMEGGDVSGSNAYYTLFNHGGPHVDAPNHFGAGDGIDSYPVESFSGRAKVFDVSSYVHGRSVPASVFEGNVEVDDIVLIFTDYAPPANDDELPELITLTSEAAEYLANLPVKAYGTDAFSVEALDDLSMPSIHHSFLSRGIPVYEQLFNVERLLGKSEMFFSSSACH